MPPWHPTPLLPAVLSQALLISRRGKAHPPSHQNHSSGSRYRVIGNYIYFDLMKKYLFTYLVVNFLVNLYITYSGVEPDKEGGFFQVSNLHNVLMIPFFVTMMYCFKVTITITIIIQCNASARSIKIT